MPQLPGTPLENGFLIADGNFITCSPHWLHVGTAQLTLSAGADLCFRDHPALFTTFDRDDFP